MHSSSGNNQQAREQRTQRNGRTPAAQHLQDGRSADRVAGSHQHRRPMSPADTVQRLADFRCVRPISGRPVVECSSFGLREPKADSLTVDLKCLFVCVGDVWPTISCTHTRANTHGSLRQSFIQ